MIKPTVHNKQKCYFVDIKTVVNKLLVNLSFPMRRKKIILHKEITNSFVKIMVPPKQLEFLLNSKLQALIEELVQNSLLKFRCVVKQDSLDLELYSSTAVSTEKIVDGSVAGLGGKLEILSIPDWGTELVISIPCQPLASSQQHNSA